MVLINGRKFACDACIRGHRASNCSHTGRQLLPVRPKGRPSSQCNTCKAKRIEGSFHGKCHCNSTSESRSSSGEATSSAEEEGVISSTGTGGEGSKSRHSLEALMNPCRCKTTGICTCCKTNVNQENGEGQDQPMESSAGCCDGQECCSDDAPELACSSSNTEPAKNCCSHTENKEAASMPTFPAQPGLTREEIEAIVSPPCQCGENCTCPGCLRKDGASASGAKENEECPDKCLTCSACAFGLTRPSGIDIVDEWMEKDMQKDMQKDALKDKRVNGREPTHPPNKKIKLSAEDSQQAAPPPPLPPFATASNFFASHFLDPERRKYFADQMRGAGSNTHSTAFADVKDVSPDETSFGHRLAGETDEAWQIRHGFYYLTPEAVQIFDSTRKFKDERQQLEEQEERLEHSATPSESLASSGPSVMSQELTDLRRKALSARKKPASMLST